MSDSPRQQPSTVVQIDEVLLGSRFALDTGVRSFNTGLEGERSIAAVKRALATGEYVQERIPCLCGAMDELCIAEIDRYGIPHRTVICSRCALLRTNPRMDMRSIQHFYSNHYRNIYERPGHDPPSYFESQASRGRTRARWALCRMCLAPGSAVVEIGCGAGWNLIPYAKLGCRVVGWDVDERYLALGRGRGLDLRFGLLEDAVSAGDSFDVVVLSHVFEHLVDPLAALGLLRRLLRPRGVAYIEVPSAFAAARLDRYFQNAHLWSFIPETLQSVMKMGGWDCLAMNGIIESLWRPSKEGHTEISFSPVLVQRTIRTLASRRKGSWLIDREMGLRHRLWRAFDTIGPFGRVAVGGKECEP